MPETDPAFAAFCESGLWPGLSRTLAAGLPDAGIHGPDDVTAERLGALPQVGSIRAGRLLSAWIGSAGTYETARLIVAAGLPARLAGRASEVIGDDAARRLRDDPWLLVDLPEVRIVEADRFAVTTVPGVRRDDPRRARALVVDTLNRAARDGHTAVPVELVVAALAASDAGDPKAAVVAACDSRGVVAATLGGTAVLALARYAGAEERAAEALARLSDTAKPIADDRADDGADDPPDESLDAGQQRAVAAALEHGVSVLTGGPGTGKSRTVASVVRRAERAGARIALAAPTGRAAKRLEELAGAPASTLHRLLGAQAGGRSRPGSSPEFARGEGWPLDADLVVVDEASMLDADLADALLVACADGTHLLVVGDAAQLPSIGPGRVLADIVESGVIPVTELTTLYRQAEGGAIARLATAVRAGDLPPVEDPDREVVIVPARGSAEAGHRTVQLVTDSIPRALSIEPSQIQVVTPVHKGPAGTIALNRVLKAALNPGDGTVGGFDVGDRVVATANHLDVEPNGFANGEVGVVTAARDGAVTVDFASGPATVRGRSLSDIVHGWAITVHRAQGSEWPAVVAVFPPEAGGLLSRPLVYTALTRARAHLSVVHAAGPALAHAVRRIGSRPRRTRLGELLTDAIPE
jgi:exodeoxyribonuclease V alpha subunit